MVERLIALVVVFVPLSLVSLGGGSSIFAEMQRQAVEVHGWMGPREFNDLFAISRAAPGPGSLISALVGWQAAGFWGALAAALGLYVPSACVLLVVGGWWRRRGDSPVRRVIERGLAPVAVGLILAGVLILLRADGAGWLEFVTLGLCTLALLRGASPYLVMLVVALLYAALQHGGLLPG
jgi:chromate transporter